MVRGDRMNFDLEADHTPEAAAQRISRYIALKSANPFDPRQLFGCHRHQKEGVYRAPRDAILDPIAGKCGLSESDRRLGFLPAERTPWFKRHLPDMIYGTCRAEWPLVHSNSPSSR